ncbi:MAG: UDP-N-acetylglucosamine 2-epimerase [Pseudomonadota bacterium]
MSQKKIAVVTSSRADFGLLLPVIKKMEASEALDVEVWVTGSHLSTHFGMTVQDIEKAGLSVSEKVPSIDGVDSEAANTRSIARGLDGFADVLSRKKPDLIMVLGDRFEILSVALAALFFKIPLAHLCGGDVTQGAFDESTRHSITKCSHIHFVTNEVARRRVIQMGENPELVFNFGSPAIDLMNEISLMDKAQLEENLNIEFSTTNFLVTFHPETLASGNSMDSTRAQVEEFFAALEAYSGRASFFITGVNPDKSFSVVEKKIAQFCQNIPKAYSFSSLGQKRYWSLMQIADVVVGNSSSGLYEAPSYKTPTVNVGDRQKGRLMATSVLSVPNKKEEIQVAIEKALKANFKDVSNPYGSGGAAAQICKKLESISNFSHLIQKRFYDFD